LLHQCSTIKRLRAIVPALRCGAARHSYSEGSGTGGLTARLAALEWSDRIPVLSWIGKHSLAFYLAHQPVLISLVWLFAQVSPPPTPDQGALFLNSCNAECVSFRDEIFCNSYCGCLFDTAEANGFLDQLFTPDAATTSRLQ